MVLLRDWENGGKLVLARLDWIGLPIVQVTIKGMPGYTRRFDDVFALPGLKKLRVVRTLARMEVEWAALLDHPSADLPKSSDPPGGLL